MRQSDQAQQSGTRSALVAGLGAAFVASILMVTMSPRKPQPAPAPVAQAQTQAPEKSCQKVPLVWFVSSTVPDGGTVRLREGNYVTPAIKLTTQPQAVVFPGMRGEATFKEPIIVNGDASNLVVENITRNFRHVYQLNGTTTIDATWVPLTTCQVGTVAIPEPGPQWAAARQ